MTGDHPIDRLLLALQPYLPYALAGLLVVLLALLVVAWQRRKAARARLVAPGTTAAAAAAAETPPGRLQRLRARLRAAADLAQSQAFGEAVRTLRRHVPNDDLYALPWFLLIGAQDAGKTTLLAHLNLEAPLGDPLHERGLGDPSCLFWPFERGVVLDVAGAVFDPGLRDEEGRFKGLLRLLQRYRPKRPLDGLLLALPADELKALAPEALIERGRLIHRRLWLLQRVLGLSVPIYVVLTKCDQLYGFKALWQQLPAGRWPEIFGWSSPYRAEHQFAEAWIDEAFGEIRRQLDLLQLELAAGGAGGDADGMFLFPPHLEALREPLRRLLGQAFRPSAYHAGFVVRGLYFTGSVEAGAQARPALAGHLLDQKVFREFGLAQPFQPALLARNRRVRLVQAALASLVLVACAGLAIATTSLARDVATLRPNLRQIGDTIATMRAREQRVRAAEATAAVGLGDVDFYEEAEILRLFEAMARFDAGELGSVFMPTSLASDVNERLAVFLSDGFDTVVMRAIYNELRLRTERALAEVADDQGPDADRAPPASLELDRSPEFRRLADLVAELREIDRLAGLYNGLGRTRSLADVRALVSGLFDAELPSFGGYTYLISEALADVQYEPFVTTTYQARATNRLRRLAWRVFDGLFEAGPFEQALFQLTRALREVAAPLLGADAKAQALREVQLRIQAAQALLASPEAAWIGAASFDLGAAHAEVLDRVRATSFFAPDLADSLARTSRSDFARFQDKLAAYGAPLTGPVLARDGDRVRPALSPAVQTLGASLDELFGQTFMEPVLPRELRRAGEAGAVLAWRDQDLDRALDLFAAHDGFVVRRLSSFPDELRARVRELAGARLSAAMLRAVADAQQLRQRDQASWRPAAEPELLVEVQAFRSAGPRLDRIIGIFEQLGRLETARALEAVVVAQASALLAELDRLLAVQGPYLPLRPLDFWLGETPVLLAAYDVGDDLEAQLYLDFQRERIAFLLREIGEPLLDSLARHDRALAPAVRAPASRWQRIAAELAKYDNRRSDSSLVALERFIRFDLAKLDLAGCAASSLEVPGNIGRDFFAERLGEIVAIVRGRCFELHEGAVIARYEAVARTFNGRLAGHFPFAGAAALANDVEPATVAAFFRAHGEELLALAEGLATVAPAGNSSREAREFLLGLEAVRAFLRIGPDEEGAEPWRPRLLVVPEFRAARALEIEANQIIDWRLGIGTQEAAIGEAAPLRWTDGEAATLTLRWASDAPLRPVGVTGRDAEIDGRRVRFTARGPWALLRLIEQHRVPASLAARAEDDPHLLSFELHTAPSVERAGAGAASGSARALLRLRLFAEDAAGEAGERLRMPRFPHAAPLVRPVL